MLPEGQPVSDSSLRATSIVSPLAFLAFTCVPTAIAYLAGSSPECCMGTPGTEIAICYGGSAFIGILLGLTIRPATTLARRALFLSPFLSGSILTIGAFLDSRQGNTDVGQTMMMLILLPLLFYILMAPTAGFFRLTQWIRENRL